MAGTLIDQCVTSIEHMLQNGTICDGDRVSLRVFRGNSTHLVHTLSTLGAGTRESLVQAIRGTRRQCSDGTPFYDALADTAQSVCSAPRLDAHRVTLVVLTDGEDNNSKRHGYAGALCAVQSLAQARRDAQLLVITAGALANYEQIQALVKCAPNGSSVIRANATSAGIAEAYDRVARLLVSARSGGGTGTDRDIVGTQDLFMSAFSLVASGENGHFSSELIWRVACRLLNLQVVAMARRARRIDALALRQFFHVQRTLRAMLEQPEQRAVRDSLVGVYTRFVDPSTPNERRRDACPDLGEFMQVCAALPAQVQWPALRPVLLQEMFRRSSRYLRRPPATGTAEQQLAHVFAGSKQGGGIGVSLRLMALACALAGEVSRTEALACYEQHGTYSASPEAERALLARLEAIAALDDPVECLAAVGLDAPEALRLLEYGAAYAAEPSAPAEGSREVLASRNIRGTALSLAEPQLAVPARGAALSPFVCFASEVDTDCEKADDPARQCVVTPRKRNTWCGVHLERGRAYQIRFEPLEGCQKGTGSQQQGANMSTLRLCGNPRASFVALPSDYAGYASSGKRHDCGRGYTDNAEGPIALGAPFEIRDDDDKTSQRVSVLQHGRVLYCNVLPGSLALVLKNGTARIALLDPAPSV